MRRTPCRFLSLLFVGLSASPSRRSSVAAAPAAPAPSTTVAIVHRRRHRRPTFLTRTADPPAVGPAVAGRGGGIQAVADDEERYRISLSPLAFASVFGFLGGWSHALCNKMFDAYTSLLTGHYLNMSMAIAEKDWRTALWRLSVIFSYIGGTASASRIEVRCQRSRQGKEGAKGVAAAPSNRHFQTIAPLSLAIFVVSDRLHKGKLALLAFGYGLVYPSVVASLGGTITHLMTGHTTNVARLLGANKSHHKGMKTSLCVLGSVICGAIFGTKALEVLGEGFPYFSVLGFLYAGATLLLL